MPIDFARSALATALVAALGASSGTAAAGDPFLALTGPANVVYRSVSDGCAPIDTPDIDARAFRDAGGDIAMFTLHYVNRALRGPDLSHLKLDCAVALNSGLDGDPARYNDRRYMTATWTDDGKRVAGVVHHEYHADDHGRCKAHDYLGCWFNSILSFSSIDGGHSFTIDRPAVIASAPFAQDVEQGHHRGFFNPSNIVSDGVFKYFMASTTGWTGQPFGVCLFRSPDPMEPGSWRAYDGVDFTIKYADPYTSRSSPPRPCAIIDPFIYPVGTIVRHAPSGKWISVWMAKKDDGAFPVSGFYYASATDLRRWSPPRLLQAGATIHDGACGGRLIAYPSIIDESSRSRNFDVAGGSPWLYYVDIAMRGCETGERLLTRRRLDIGAGTTERGR